MMSAEKLLHWALDSALPPTTLVNAMQLAQLDPAVELFYPELSKNIDVILKVSGYICFICIYTNLLFNLLLSFEEA